MTRLALVLATWMSIVGLAPASLTPRKEPAPDGAGVARSWGSKPSAEALDKAAAPRTKPEYILTTDTEIWLNGKPCRYEAIPADARILRMEVGADKKTVLRVYFRTRK